MRYANPDWDAAVEALARADSVAIACHVNPDGDALGSLLGASIGLRKIGKTTYPTWSDGAVELPFSYAYLAEGETLVRPDDVPQTDVFLALDCGAGDRLGELEKAARSAPVLINVDHHPGNDNFGDLNIVVTRVSSTAELVTRLLQDLGVELDRDIATCLYTGIVTDTGRFQFANAGPDTLRLAADLIAVGVPVPDVAARVYESSPFSFLKLIGRMLERATLVAESAFAYSWITQDDLEETGVAMEETDQLIDVLRSTRDAAVAALFKEQEDGSYRVSLRSRGPSVGAIARAHGGGGHELAAGYTTDSVEAAVAQINSALGA